MAGPRTGYCLPCSAKQSCGDALEMHSGIFLPCVQLLKVGDRGKVRECEALALVALEMVRDGVWRDVEEGVRVYAYTERGTAMMPR